jgi:hypothetical protein
MEISIYKQLNLITETTQTMRQFSTYYGMARLSVTITDDFCTASIATVVLRIVSMKAKTPAWAQGMRTAQSAAPEPASTSLQKLLAMNVFKLILEL